MAALPQQGDADDGVRDRGQGQRPTHGRSDADVLLLGGGAEHDGDEGDDAFGQRGTECGEDGCRARILSSAV